MDSSSEEHVPSMKIVNNLSSKKVLVHASNITGLGAIQVVSSLLNALNPLLDEAIYILPEEGVLSEQKFSRELGGQKIYFHRRYGHFISRTMECMFPSLFFPDGDATIVLGDIPLRGVKNQIVLVHQPNLLAPSVSSYSSSSIKFKFLRMLFKYNLKGVKTIVVQTDVMKDQMIESYPSLRERVAVISQPTPSWFKGYSWKGKRCCEEGLSLFYPAAGYPHKNHILIEKLSQSNELISDIKEIIITLNDDEKHRFNFQRSKVNNVGRLSPQNCINYYRKVDALFFPSVAESYGLPLVEAMVSSIPILCSDLPYARWLCEDNAIYFDPQNVESASKAISEMKNRLRSGWSPNWEKALAKLPSTWDEVGKQFVQLLGDGRKV